MKILRWLSGLLVLILFIIALPGIVPAFDYVEIVEIDIKPGSDSNPINPNVQGIVPVAILGSFEFDPSSIDVTTVAFGPYDAVPAHRNPHLEDVNEDGLIDSVWHFRFQETGIEVGDTLACVNGELLDGTLFEGCDDIMTVQLP